MRDLHKVRVEIGESAIFTKVFIDDVEVRGVTRVWFDSGDVNPKDGPRRSFMDSTRVHLEFYPQSLMVTGDTAVDLIERRPVESAS